MIVKKFIVNPLQENCYVVSDDSKECVIIDCGACTEEERAQITDYIDDNGLKPVHMLLTHGHIDHSMGCNTIYDKYGIKPELHYGDEKLYMNYQMQAEAILGQRLMYELPAIGRCFNNGDTVTFGNTEIKVIATPGHSQGGVFYLIEREKIAFSGDTLFRDSIGRTDFPGGSMFQIINSLRFVAQMADDIKLYTGHGAETTIGDEVAHNPYMDR